MKEAWKKVGWLERIQELAQHKRQKQTKQRGGEQKGERDDWG